MASGLSGALPTLLSLMLTMPPSLRASRDARAGVPRRALGGALAALRWLGAASLLVCSVVFGAWLVLQWGILPRIEHWRPVLEARASEALGVPVRIGVIGITAGGAGRWSRAVELRDVVLYAPAVAVPLPGAAAVTGAPPPAAASPAPAATSPAPAGVPVPPREALRLPRVHALLSLTSLLPGWDGRWQPRFEQLRIEAATLDLRRDVEGRLHLAGLPSQGGEGADGRVEDWFFSQPHVTLHAAALHWHDEQRGAAPVRLAEVELDVRNGLHRHVLALRATPPAEWGERFTLQGDFTQPLIGGEGGLLARAGDWRRWSGRVDLQGPAIDLAPLHRHGLLPPELAGGRGAARVELDVQEARLTGARLDLDLRDVSLRPDPRTPPLLFTQLAGRLGGRIDLTADGRWAGAEVQAERLGFTTAQGRVWPAGDLRLRWRGTAGGGAEGGELQADRLDLALLQDLVVQLPPHWLDEAAPGRLRSLDPGGVARGVQLSWSGAVRAPSRYRLQARLVGLRLAAGAVPPARAADDVPLGRPGLDGADIELLATEAGGQARVALQDGGLEFPGLFERPRIALDRLDADVSWRIDTSQEGAWPAVEVRAQGVRFAHADARGGFDITWASARPGVPSGPHPSTGAPRADADSPYPGTIDLQGRLDHAEADRAARYLPLHIPAGVRRYVRQAVLGGRAEAVHFKVRGDLRDFPFPSAAPGRAAAGEFRVAVPLKGVRLAYLPEGLGAYGKANAAKAPAERPWPAFSDVEGELVFERRSLRLAGLQGRLASVGGGGLQVSGVHGGIDDWDDRATLRLEGDGRGPPADALAFVAGTPVGGWIGGALAQATAPGRQPPLALRLALELPLHGTDAAPVGEEAAPTAKAGGVAPPAPQERAAQVRGRLVLAGNDLRLRPDVPPLSRARARIDFTERGFSIAAGSAGLLGGQARVQGGQQPDGSVRIEVQGTATAAALREAGELGALAKAAAHFRGETGYQLAFGVRDDTTDWQLRSDLVGLAADLPAPLGKTAEQALALRVRSGAPPPAPALTRGAPGRDELRIELGPEAAPLLQAHWLREVGPNGARVLSGGIGVSDAAPQPARGVAASLRLDRLDVDAWQALAQRWRGGAPAGSGMAGSAGGDRGAAYRPDTVTLQVQTLQLGGREFHDVVAGLSQGQGPQAAAWRANVDARELHGYGEYHPAGVRGAEGAGRVLARVTRLALPESEADAVGSLLEQAQPTRLPALDLVIDDLALRDKRLGRVEVLAHNRRLPGGAAGWQLERLRITTPEARLEASGEWAAPPEAGAPRTAVLDFALDVSDGGALLGRLGQPGVVRGATGRLSGQVRWLGSPLALDIPSLSGRITADFNAGQFLQAEPGMAKLLGVLSLQTLPRRLLLDFRDVFAQGFAFDSVGGEARIEQGVASTRNLRLRGVQAVVLMEGSADIGRETQDLRVWVVPEINAGAASLAVAVINPAVGLGSFLAQWLLRRPLALAGTREFHVTGPWAAPQVERIERSDMQAPPASGEPAAAPRPPTGAARAADPPVPQEPP